MTDRSRPQPTAAHVPSQPSTSDETGDVVDLVPAAFGPPPAFVVDEDPLPGMGEPERGAGVVETAAHRTIRALPSLGPQHAVMAQALLVCARQLDRATASGRAKDYGVAELLSQLRETFKVLCPDEPEGAGQGDAFDALAADLRAAAEQQRTGGGGSG